MGVFFFSCSGHFRYHKCDFSALLFTKCAKWRLVCGRGVHLTARSLGIGEHFMTVSSGVNVHCRKYYYYDIFKRFFEGRKLKKKVSSQHW